MARRALRCLSGAASLFSETVRSTGCPSKAGLQQRSAASNALRSLLGPSSSAPAFKIHSNSRAYYELSGGNSSFPPASGFASAATTGGDSGEGVDQSSQGSDGSEAEPVTDDPVTRGSQTSAFSSLTFHLPPPTLKPGRATPEGTARFALRHRDTTGKGHFRSFQSGDGLESLRLSSAGVGTFLRSSKASADSEYEFIINHSLKKGLNVFDSNILTRNQYSERCIGRVIQSQINEGKISRDEVFISTKGGMLYTPKDISPVDKDQLLEQVYYKNGIFTPSDIFQNLCLEPKFLELQINASRRNLGVDCIDVYYLQSLHQLLRSVKREVFIEKVKAAFQFLEEKCKEGKIASYGIYSTKSPLLNDHPKLKISIPELVNIAKEVGGESHRFKSIQIPINLCMMEMLSDKKAQMLNGKYMSVMDCAKLLQLNVFSSTMHYQGSKFRDALENTQFGLRILGKNAPFARQALQFSRSLPDVISSIVSFQTKREALNLFKCMEYPCNGVFTEKESKTNFEDIPDVLEE